MLSQVYHTTFEPLEWALNVLDFTDTEAANRKEFDRTACGAKLICNKAEDNHVVGLHYLGKFNCMSCEPLCYTCVCCRS